MVLADHHHRQIWNFDVSLTRSLPLLLALVAIYSTAQEPTPDLKAAASDARNLLKSDEEHIHAVGIIGLVYAKPNSIASGILLKELIDDPRNPHLTRQAALRWLTEPQINTTQERKDDVVKYLLTRLALKNNDAINEQVPYALHALPGSLAREDVQNVLMSVVEDPFSNVFTRAKSAHVLAQVRKDDKNLATAAMRALYTVERAQNLLATVLKTITNKHFEDAQTWEKYLAGKLEPDVLPPPTVLAPKLLSKQFQTWLSGLDYVREFKFDDKGGCTHSSQTLKVQLRTRAPKNVGLMLYADAILIELRDKAGKNWQRDPLRGMGGIEYLKTWYHDGHDPDVAKDNSFEQTLFLSNLPLNDFNASSLKARMTVKFGTVVSLEIDNPISLVGKKLENAELLAVTMSIETISGSEITFRHTTDRAKVGLLQGVRFYDSANNEIKWNHIKSIKHDNATESQVFRLKQDFPANGRIVIDVLSNVQTENLSFECDIPQNEVIKPPRPPLGP